MRLTATLLAGLAAALALTAGTAAAPEARAAEKGRQVAFLNHAFAVLDTDTATAIGSSEYLKRFGVFEERTTTNGSMTYTGRYLYGRETYVEFFAEGALPPPSDARGASGLALGTEREGDLDTVTQRLRELGVAEPVVGTQTRAFDGEQVPWFDLVLPSVQYERSYSWVMEYLPSYFADPRTGRDEPPSFPGDVSRERYLPDTYRDRMMRDIVGVDLAVPPADLPALVLTLRAGGFAVQEDAAGVRAVGRGGTVVTIVAAQAAGLRKIEFTLNAPPAGAHVEQIGHSTLTVGPGKRASWVFD